MAQEYEIVSHTTIHNFKLFLVNLQYREPHIHSDLEICCVLDGQVSFLSRDQKLSLGTGDFVLLNSCQAHEIFSPENAPALLLAIQVLPGFCKEYFPALPDLEFSFCRGSSCFPEIAGKLLCALMVRLAGAYFQKQTGFEFQCSSILNLIFFCLIRLYPYRPLSSSGRQKQTIRNRRLWHLVSEIENHYTEKLLLSDLAKKEGLSMSYLSHFFKEHFQLSFQEYLSGLRCEKARQLLLLTNHTLLDISMESGFSDIKYMTRAFLSRYGCTPKAYREQFLEEDLPKQQKTLLSIQNFYSDTASLTVLKPYLQQACAFLAAHPGDLWNDPLHS